MEQQTLHRTIGRPLDRPQMTFDLNSALKDLRAEAALEREGRNAIILHKEPGLKVVLIALRRGGEILAHKAQAPITVQALEGRIRFQTAKGAQELRAGELLTLHAGEEHSLKALEESAFLLTIASGA